MTFLETDTPYNGSHYRNRAGDVNSAEAAARLLGGNKATRSGDNWLTCCPAHDDHTPSLTLSDRENGALLFHCHAGCSQMAVLAALARKGVAVAARREVPVKVVGRGNIAALERQGFEVKAVYDYCDASGVLLYQNVRLERYAHSGERIQKTFRQRRPDLSGTGWIDDLNGMQRVPYRLPDVLRRAEEDVHLAEGEKDADALATLGLLGSCITGSGVDLKFLRGRRVWIHEDNDKAGRQKAAGLAAALQGVASCVQILRYPDAWEGGDVSNWLTGGHTIEDLLEKIDVVERNPLTGTEQCLCMSRCLADVKPEPIKWLWQGRIARGKLNLLAGQPGRGKSQLTIYMAAQITIGGEWPDGLACPLGSVICISCEDDAADTIVPRLMAAGADRSRVHVLDWVVNADGKQQPSKQMFDLRMHVPALADLIRRVGDVVLIIIDPSSAYLGALDSHKTSDVRGGLAPLQQLAAETGAAVLLVSHLNKGSMDGNAMARVAGSGAFVAACRSAWLVETDPEDEQHERRILTPLKNNIGDDQTGFAFTIKPVHLADGIESSRVVFEPGTVSISATDLLRGYQNNTEDRGALGEAVDFLREYLNDGPKNAKSTQGAAEDAGIAPRTLRRAREQLGIKPKKSTLTSQWVWALSESPDRAQPNNEVGQGGQLDQHDACTVTGPEAGLCNGTNTRNDGQVGHLGQQRSERAGDK